MTNSSRTASAAITLIERSRTAHLSPQGIDAWFESRGWECVESGFYSGYQKNRTRVSYNPFPGEKAFAEQLTTLIPLAAEKEGLSPATVLAEMALFSGSDDVIVGGYGTTYQPNIAKALADARAIIKDCHTARSRETTTLVPLAVCKSAAEMLEELCEVIEVLAANQAAGGAS